MVVGVVVGVIVVMLSLYSGVVVFLVVDVFFVVVVIDVVGCKVFER